LSGVLFQLRAGVRGRWVSTGMSSVMTELIPVLPVTACVPFRTKATLKT
jgi:hypothetical protein